MGRRFAFLILLFGAILTLASSVLQLGLDYRRGLEEIDARLQQSHAAYAGPLAASLHAGRLPELRHQLEGALRPPELYLLEVLSARGDTLAAAGAARSGGVLARVFPLVVATPAGPLRIGQLRATASLDGARRRLLQQVRALLIAQAFKSVLVALFILALFEYMVGRHLSRIAGYSDRLYAGELDSELALERRAGAGANELDQTAAALNAMHQRLAQSFRKLQESEFRWKFALEGAGDGVWDYRIDSGAVVFSRQWMEMLGYREGELPGRIETFSRLAHPEDLKRAELKLNENFIGASDTYNAELRMLCKDGGWKWVMARGMVVAKDAQGRAVRMIGTHTDVSARHGAEDALRELNEQLESRVDERTRELRQAMAQIIESEKLASLGALVAGVSHELNTPIGNMVLAASALSDQLREIGAGVDAGKLTRSGLAQLLLECGDASAIIVRNGNRASDLIDSFKRVSVDQTSQRRRRFDLRTTVQDSLNALGAVTRRAKATVELQIPDDIEMDSFPGPLEQIINNIIMNSITHGFEDRAGGRIVLRARLLENGMVEMDYADDGHGIAAALQHKVFEPFYTTKLGQGGSGLGLSIVHNLVQAIFKGRLRLESAPGQGVQLHFVFPAVTPQS